jgi:hypothetical protein
MKRVIPIVLVVLVVVGLLAAEMGFLGKSMLWVKGTASGMLASLSPVGAVKGVLKARALLEEYSEKEPASFDSGEREQA